MTTYKTTNMTTATLDATDDVQCQCECGEITGERCHWSGPASETVMVEHMPPHFRASHSAARNAGVYPHNGAIRVIVSLSCADELLDGWTDIVAHHHV
jgi:hypothetical protein